MSETSWCCDEGRLQRSRVVVDHCGNRQDVRGMSRRGVDIGRFSFMTSVTRQSFVVELIFRFRLLYVGLGIASGRC